MVGGGADETVGARRTRLLVEALYGVHGGPLLGLGADELGEARVRLRRMALGEGRRREKEREGDGD